MGSGAPVVTVLIPLPLTYNPDKRGRRRRVERSKFEITADEMATHLHEGGTLFVYRDGHPTGFWWNEGIVERDVHALLEVDMPDTPANRLWLRVYARNVLLKRFRQKAIYVKIVGPVERWVVTEEELTLE